MNSSPITGFSPLQKQLADRIWTLADPDIAGFISTLPRNLRREAEVVMTMILVTELDNYQEVDHAVIDYLRSL
jgi:hypothetical protein